MFGELLEQDRPLAGRSPGTLASGRMTSADRLVGGRFLDGFFFMEGFFAIGEGRMSRCKY